MLHFTSESYVVREYGSCFRHLVFECVVSFIKFYGIIEI